MKISVLEDRIEVLEGTKLFAIIELIITAVRDYPLYGLDDTDLYFEEIKKTLECNYITASQIREYLQKNINNSDENFIWMNSSLSSLLEAFNLMGLYEISFEEVLDKITELS